VLVGTISIDVSEKISAMLKKEKALPTKCTERQAPCPRGGDHRRGRTARQGHHRHQHGRARHRHQARAGGGEVGGLHILGTSRHESRRIDNQLRGRAGRQGDPGSSRFYLSLEDDLLRIFGSDRISTIMNKLGMEEDEPIEHGMISRAIENAQRKVEGHNFDIRKHLLEYDDVMNKQREIIYRQRRDVLAGEDVVQVVQDMFEDMVDTVVAEFHQEKIDSPEWHWPEFKERMVEVFHRAPEWPEEELHGLKLESFRTKTLEFVRGAYAEQDEVNGAETQRQIEKLILLQVVDSHWKDHLLSMDHLKEGIGLRGYGQKNPLNEYKREGFQLFQHMVETVKGQIVSSLMRVRVVREDDVERMEAERRRKQEQEMLRMNRSSGGEPEGPPKPVRREGDKTGRNALCPCGSGKKYKRCCGRRPERPAACC
jgi:preprotein translocase subunit SecA